MCIRDRYKSHYSWRWRCWIWWKQLLCYFRFSKVHPCQNSCNNSNDQLSGNTG